MLQAISPFYHNVFHSYISLVCQSAALCGNGLWFSHTCMLFLWHSASAWTVVIQLTLHDMKHMVSYVTIASVPTLFPVSL